MKVKRKKAYYSISAVSKMFSVHQQTIRLYEKQGLITPRRSSGNTRLFEEEDIDRLEEIIYLTHQLGINLAGVEMILKLKKQMHKMQREMNTLFETAQDELNEEVESSQRIIKENTQRLTLMKNAHHTTTPTLENREKNDIPTQIPSPNKKIKKQSS